MDWSIITPTHNEEHWLGNRWIAAQEYIDQRQRPIEIFVSDDGSTNRTMMVATPMIVDTCHRILTSAIHRGKGAAVPRGILATCVTNM